MGRRRGFGRGVHATYPARALSQHGSTDSRRRRCLASGARSRGHFAAIWCRRGQSHRSGLRSGLKSGHLLPLADTRYVLVEPPHHVAPQRMDELFFNVQAAGYVPILTHPERLSWITDHYDVSDSFARNGVWMQITASSLTGAFGRNPLYWANRMLDDGVVQILATDAHDVVKRPPRLSEGYYAAAKRVGDAEAANLVLYRPRGILENALPSTMPAPRGLAEGSGVTNVDASGKRRSERSFAQGNDSDSPHGIADRLRRFFK